MVFLYQSCGQDWEAEPLSHLGSHQALLQGAASWWWQWGVGSGDSSSAAVTTIATPSLEAAMF